MVYAGAAAYVDASGNTWLADQAFTAGGWGFIGGFTKTSTNPIANTTDDPLFQIDHRWTSSALPGYSFSVPNGNYNLTLRFAEFNAANVGERLFDIVIEGATVAANFDILAAAGGANTAVDRTFAVAVTDGQLDVSFVRRSGNPKVSALRIQSMQGAPTTPTATATPTNPPAATATPTPNNLYLLRVNAGGAAYTDPQGNQWQADRAFGAGPWGYDGASAAVGATTHAIANTTSDPLYQSDRRWSNTEGTARYRFTVPNGSYQVILHFAEGDYNAVNQRVFAVKIEGTTRLAGYDIYAQAGHDSATMQSFTVSVSDGVLNIVLTPSIGQPKINAIELQQISSALAPLEGYPGVDDK
jgi:hypothetical protein